MKVTMIKRLDTQWSEGGEWRSYPSPGEVLDTDAVHAADLCRQGYAKPVAEEQRAETRPAADTSEKRATPATAKASAKDSKNT